MRGTSGRMSIQDILNAEQPQQALPLEWSDSPQTRSDGESSNRSYTPESGYYSAAADSPELSSAQRLLSPGSSHSQLTRRLSSAASNASHRVEKTRREFRPPYTEEEQDFIWYHKEDLKLEWKDVKLAFTEQFRERSRNYQGLQCKHYRHIEGYGLPKIRQRDKHAPTGNHGILANSRHRYHWMRPEHQVGEHASPVGPHFG